MQPLFNHVSTNIKTMTTLNTVFGIFLAFIGVLVFLATLCFVMLPLSRESKFSEKDTSTENNLNRIRYKNRKRKVAEKAAMDFETIKTWDTAG